MRPMKIGLVEWEDAQTLRKEEELPKSCPIMKSVGYIIKTKKYLLIISLLTPDDGGGLSTIIPLGVIKKIKWLK